MDGGASTPLDFVLKKMVFRSIVVPAKNRKHQRINKSQTLKKRVVLYVSAGKGMKKNFNNSNEGQNFPSNVCKSSKNISAGIIYEVAWVIEESLSKDNYLLASLSGIAPEMVGDYAINIAIKEVKEALNPATPEKPEREWLYAIIAKHLKSQVRK